MAGKDSSTLEISVITTGIGGAGGASAQLNKLGDNAERTEVRVKKLTDSINLLTNAQKASGTAALEQANSLSGINKAMDAIALSSKNTAAAIAQLNTHIGQLGVHQTEASRTTREWNTHGNVMTNTLKAMATAAIAYTGVNFAMNIVKQADAWQSMTAKLQLATGSLNNAKATQESLFELAQKLRVPLEDVSRLYTRVALPMKELGKSSKQTLEMVEGVSLALQLNGSTAAEASSVMLQFSQSIAAGRLNGAELNAVLEGARPLVVAIRDELTRMGKQLNPDFEMAFGQIKKLGAEGKLSVELIARAMENAMPDWRKKFESLPITVNGAMQIVKNSWFKAMGELNENSGFTTGIVNALAILEKLIPDIKDGMVGAFVAVMEWIDKNKAGLYVLWEQIKLLGKDIWGIVEGIFGFATGTDTALSGVEILGSAVLGVRLMLAAMVDVVKLIGASFVHVGTDIFKVMTTPLTLVLDMISAIAGKIGNLFAGMSNGLNGTMFQDTDAHKALKTLSKGAQSVSDNTAAVTGKFRETIAAGRELGDTLQKGWTTGKTEVAKVLEGETARLAILKERHVYEENFGKAVKPKGDDKGAKAAASAMKKELDDFNKHTQDLATAIEQQKELKRGMDVAGLDYEKMGKGAKEEIRLKYELDQLSKRTLTNLDREHAGNLRKLLAQAQELRMWENTTATMKAGLEESERMSKDTETRIQNINEEALVMERKVLAYGQAEGAVTELAIAELMQRRGVLEGFEGSEKAIEQIDREIAANQRLANSKTAFGIKEDGKKALADLDKYLNPKKALDFGNSFKEAFGKAGEAIDKLGKAFDSFGSKQAKIADARKRADVLGLDDAKKAATIHEQITQEEATNRISLYGDMANAAQSFFKEGSAGYKVLGAAEKAFRVMEMAMTIESTAVKLFGSGAVVAAKTAEVGAGAAAVAADTGFTAVSIGNSMARAGASLAAGVGKAFEQMGVWGFVAAGAMVAVMASVGFGGGGSSSGPNITAEQRQKKQGTGSVLGDETAKSESLSNSLGILAENSKIGLRYSSNMLTALNKIKDGIGGLATFVTQATGLRGTAADTAGLGLGQSKGFLGFSSKSTTLTDTGLLIAAGQTIGSVIAKGITANSYQDVRTDKSSFFGLSKSTTQKTNIGEVDSSLTQQFAMTVGTMADAVGKASGFLKINGSSFVNELNAMSLGLDKISFKDMTGQQIQDELNAVFSKLGDDMVRIVAPSMGSFQKAGEGLLQTLIRVTSGIDVANGALLDLGIQAIDFNAVVNRVGDIGAEIVRETLMQAEMLDKTISLVQTDGKSMWFNTAAAFTGIGEIIQNMTGDAQALVDMYRQLTNIRESMMALKLGDGVTMELIGAAGGVDALQSSITEFTDRFYNEAEKTAMKGAALTTSFSKLGIAMPKTNLDFRNLIIATAALGTSGEVLLGKLLGLSGAFADFTDVVVEAGEKELTTAEKLTEARDTLSEAYERESSALAATKSKFEEFSKSLRTFRDGLLIGSLSTLTNLEKYQTGKALFEDTASKAQAGDVNAISKFQTAASDFLNLSRVYNASGEAYTADFERVVKATESLAESTDLAATDAQRQLDALTQTVSQLISIKETLVSVHQAIVNVGIALGNDKQAVPVGAQAGMIESLYQSNLGRAADTGGMAYYNAALNSGSTIGQLDTQFKMSDEYITKTVNELYQNILGRTPEPDGLQFWTTAMKNGLTAAEVAKSISVSAENVDGSHASGLSYVPFDGYRAELHEGEGVLTAAENKQYQMGNRSGADRELIQVVETLKMEMVMLKEEARQHANNIIGSNYDANGRAAETVVEGMGDAMSKSSRADAVKPTLN